MKCICGKFDNSVRIPAMPITDSDLMAITIPSANMAGTAVERARHQDAASRLEAARQNERLRSILLDALAHDFTTPLTSIKGAITAGRSAYQHEAEEDDLLEVVEEESDKLTGMIDVTVAMARIETGRARFQRSRLTILVQSECATRGQAFLKTSWSRSLRGSIVEIEPRIRWPELEWV